MTFLDKADGAERQNTHDGERRVVNLALQGGGSHGAFAWGVLDRLLEEETLYFEGISGTSAGAAKAVVLADGFAAGGREGAREALRLLAKSVRSLVSRTLQASSDRRRESRFRTRKFSGLSVH
jgi:predicted acylesterase/phospholipase RssA